VRVAKYSWGPATANALAVKLTDARWLLVGCPIDASEDGLAELAQEGEVALLLAPNAYHYLGQAGFRHRFPGARSFAPLGAHARLARKSPDVVYEDLSQLERLLPGHVQLVVPDGQKSPDSLLRVRVSGQTVWWLGDLFSNTSAADAAWWLRLASRLAGSGPGYRCSSRPELVYVSDRRAWLSSVSNALAAAPPSVVVPAHGEPVTLDAERLTSSLLERMLAP
jgi:hypothetical protein